MGNEKDLAKLDEDAFEEETVVVDPEDEDFKDLDQEIEKENEGIDFEAIKEAAQDEFEKVKAAALDTIENVNLDFDLKSLKRKARDGFDKLKEMGNDAADDAREKAAPAIDKAKAAFDETVEKAKLAIDDTINKASTVAEETKDAIEEKADGAVADTFDKASEAVAEAGDKVKDLAAKVKLDNYGFNLQDDERDAFMLKGELAKEGYDWWWHSFTGYHAKTGEEKTFFIEFFTINPELGGAEPVYGQLPENKEKGIKPSYMMVKCGAWGEDKLQLHRFFGWDDVTISEEAPFSISADDCVLTEDHTSGYVKVTPKDAKDHPEYMSDAGTMSWDLTIDKQVAFNVGYGAGKAMRDTDAFEMFWHAQGMKTFYEGTVTYRGKKYQVKPETCYGYADKNWGKNFTSPWVWLSSNNLTSNISGERLEDSVFDIGGGKPKVGNISLDRKLLGAMWYEGTPYEYNFSKVWTLPKTKFKCVEGKNKITWKIIQETPGHKMYASIQCNKEDMILANYEAPNGEKRHNKLWNGGTGYGNIKLYRRTFNAGKPEWELVDDIDVKNCGCEYGEFDQESEEE